MRRRQTSSSPSIFRISPAYGFTANSRSTARIRSVSVFEIRFSCFCAPVSTTTSQLILKLLKRKVPASGEIPPCSSQRRSLGRSRSECFPRLHTLLPRQKLLIGSSRHCYEVIGTREMLWYRYDRHISQRTTMRSLFQPDLQFVQLTVHPAGDLNQLRVRAPLDDAPLVEHQNQVGLANSRKAMRDDKGGAVSH